MDLPVDKIRILKDYSNDKKWQLVVDQVGVLIFIVEAISITVWAIYQNLFQRLMTAQVNPSVPSEYLNKLSLFMDKKALKKSKKVLGDENSTRILKHIEISLRTNTVELVLSNFSGCNLSFLPSRSFQLGYRVSKCSEQRIAGFGGLHESPVDRSWHGVSILSQSTISPHLYTICISTVYQ